MRYAKQGCSVISYLKCQAGYLNFSGTKIHSIVSKREILCFG